MRHLTGAERRDERAKTKKKKTKKINKGGGEIKERCIREGNDVVRRRGGGEDKKVKGWQR